MKRLLIKNISFLNFRNYESKHFKFYEKTNVIYGKNAIGKTNILEGIYYALKGKSFKNAKDENLVRQGYEVAKIEADILYGDLEENIEIEIKIDRKKKISVNETIVKSLKDMDDMYSVIVFEPDDINIIKLSSFYRRNFLDEIIEGINKEYRQYIINYNKALDMRNYALKYDKNSSYYREKILSSTMQILRYGSIIIYERNKMCKKLHNIANVLYRQIEKTDENLEMIYQGSFFNEVYEIENIKKNFYDELRKTYKKDEFAGTTTIGPHKDDIIININDKNTRFFASQGQMRSVIITAKIAQKEILKKYSNKQSIVLLDDVFSELDDYRSNYLLDVLKDCQSIITTVNKTNIFENKDISFIHLE